MPMIRQGQGGGRRARLSQTTLVGGTSTSTKNNSTPTLREPSRLRTGAPSGTGTTLREHSRSRPGSLSGTGTNNPNPNPKNNYTPTLREHSRSRTGSSSGTSTRSQRQVLSATIPVPITLIPSKERLSQYDLHGHNQQADDNHVFGNAYPKFPAPNSSLFTFQNIGPQNNQLPILPPSSTHEDSPSVKLVSLFLLSTASTKLSSLIVIPSTPE